MTNAMLANLFAYSAQVLIVVAAAAIGIAAIRLPMARVRVAYWRLVVAACLALPLLAESADRVVFMPAPSAATALLTIVDPVEIPPEPALTTAEAVAWALVAGAALRMAWLGLGLLALSRLRRRSEMAALPDDVEVLRRSVAPRSSVRWHASIPQPVAFGWLRPVVLLPRRVVSLSVDAQRAVVCHELLHIARRDWVWMLAEEAIRCIFWFHPAMWFALAKLQLSREELVDEEVVRITGVRQPYVRALAMFAGEPSAFAAATPFIRRRHLVSRIRQLSKDHTMSRLRIACGFVVLVAAIGAMGWAAAFALPLKTDGTTLLPLPRATGLAPPSAQWLIDPTIPVAAAPQAANQQAANQGAAGSQQTEQINEALARAQALADAAARMHSATDAHRQTSDHTGQVHISGQLHVAGQVVSPADAATYRVAPVYPEAAMGHGVEAVVTVRVTVGTAGEVTNVETVRTRLTTERDITDPAFWAAQPSRLFGQAAEDAVRQWRFEATGETRRLELPVAFGESGQMVFVPIGGGRGAPDLTPVAIRGPSPYVRAQGDKPVRIRVGGAVRQPAMVTKVAPAYPPMAKAANIQGVVIIELVVGTDGSVQEAWVRRSIPLLDQAALDAVVQWRYEPTLLNGAPVEVIATVTVNFTLPEEQR